jgi:poly(hydroxyalkanoate) granule-associated protein
MAKKDTPPWLDRLMGGFNKDAAQQVWLAGLGALARAQAEGTKVFETLAKEGAAWQKKTSDAAEERFGDVAGKMSDLAGGMQAKAGQRWDQMEGVIEERTAKVLKRLGVPTAREIDALNARIDALNAKVAVLARAAKGPARAAAKKTAVKKAAVKKPAAKRLRKTSSAS